MNASIGVAGRATRWDTLALGAAAFVAPLLSIYAPLGMAALFAIAAAAVLIHDMIAARGWPRMTFATLSDLGDLRRYGVIAALLCLWMLASAVWAVRPDNAIGSLGQILGVMIATAILLATAARLDAAARRPVAYALWAGLLVALALFAVELFDNAWLGRLLHASGKVSADQLFSRYNRGLTVLLMLTFPALLLLKNSLARLALGVTSGAVVLLYYGSSLQLAVIGAALTVALALALPRLMPWLIGAGLALFVAVAPLLPPLLLQNIDVQEISARTHNVSIAHRFVVWRFAAEHIAEKPLFGWGMDAARSMPGGKEEVVLLPGPPPVYGEKLPLHTHNAPLQWWLELGLPGGILMALLWLGVLAVIARRVAGRADRAIALGGFVAAWIVANLSFGAWQSWWLSTLGLTAALVLLGARGKEKAA